MKNNIQSARIIDVSHSGVTFYTDGKSQTIDWPADKPTPQMGEVYKIITDGKGSPTIHERIAAPVSDTIDWKNSDALRWQQPIHGQNTSRMEILRQRHLIKRVVRDYLDSKGYIEIDMPVLVVGTTPDAEIDSYASEGRYLVTSCEYQIKRMEIGGFDKCYTMTQNFRLADTGRYRNPEFSMIEWVRIGETLADIEADAEQFLLKSNQALGAGNVLQYQGHAIDITPPWDRMTIRGAIQKYMGVNLEDFSAKSLLKAAEHAKIEVKAEWREDAIFLFSLILDRLQPSLGFEKPVFLQEWPKLMTSSADLDESGKFTQRSEAFIAGVELSDGFPTLTDYARQKTSFQDQVDRRKHENRMTVDIDQRYLDAMREGIPSGAGMALGFDRLVMLLTNQPSIATVLAFGWDELDSL